MKGIYVFWLIGLTWLLLMAIGTAVYLVEHGPQRPVVGLLLALCLGIVGWLSAVLSAPRCIASVFKLSCSRCHRSLIGTRIDGSGLCEECRKTM
jgi:hypothetical protein